MSARAAPGAAAIAGVGYTPFTRASGRSVLDQATDAWAKVFAFLGKNLGR